MKLILLVTVYNDALKVARGILACCFSANACFEGLQRESFLKVRLLFTLKLRYTSKLYILPAIAYTSKLAAETCI